MADDNKSNQVEVEEVEVEQQRAVEELLVKVPSTTVHLLDNRQSVALAHGDLEIILVRQNNEISVAVLARVGDQIQWPLTTDQPALKLDDSHYLFTLTNNNHTLNYGVTIPRNGQGELLERFDEVLEKYSGYEYKEESGASLGGGDEEWAAAYWTRLAPNVEESDGGMIARMIAAGSGMVVNGILWCGDVAVERLKWVEEILRTWNVQQQEDVAKKVSPATMERIERVKSMTIKSEQLATELLSGVIKVSQRITGTVVNSGAGKLFFNMLPGEIVLASFDAYNQVWDAVEAAGKNVMTTTSEVTRKVVTERYGEEAGRATDEGMDAVGHAIATVWTLFKIAKALNPKSALNPTSLAKAAVFDPKKLS